MTRYSLDLTALQDMSDLAGSMSQAQCATLSNRALSRADDAQRAAYRLLERAARAEALGDNAAALLAQAADAVALSVGQRNLAYYLADRADEC